MDKKKNFFKPEKPIKEILADNIRNAQEESRKKLKDLLFSRKNRLEKKEKEN